MANEDENIEPENKRTDAPVEASINDFEDAYGEKFSDTINIHKWPLGENLAELYARLEQEIQSAVKDENKISNTVRKDLFPKIMELGKIPNAGLHKFDETIIEKGHKGFLFNGCVEACDGISVVHDTLPISITQIGVCLVSYYGEQGSFVHRLYRRDLTLKGEDPVKEALNMLEKRNGRESVGIDDKRAVLSNLARRGIMAYAERAILLEKSHQRLVGFLDTVVQYRMN